MTADERPLIRMNHKGEPARFHSHHDTVNSEAVAVHQEGDNKKENKKHKKMREPAAERRNMQGKNSPSMIRAAPAPTHHCPVGQYMAKDSSQCALCFPRTLFIDRNRVTDLSQNAAVHQSCPSAYIANPLTTKCILTNLMKPDQRPVTLEDCRIPAGSLDAQTIYKLSVSFKQNGLLS